MGGVIRRRVIERLEGSAMCEDGRGVRRRRRGWVVGFDVGSTCTIARLVGSVGVGVGVGMIRSGRRPSDPL